MEFLNGPIVMALVFVFTMIIGVPIPFAAGIATVSGLIIADIPLSLMALSAWTAFEPFPSDNTFVYFSRPTYGTWRYV